MEKEKEGAAKGRRKVEQEKIGTGEGSRKKKYRNVTYL